MIRERLELHFDTLPEQSGQRSRLCGTVLSSLGVSRWEPGCPGRAPGFLRRPLVFGLRKGAVWPDGADGSALPTKPGQFGDPLGQGQDHEDGGLGPKFHEGAGIYLRKTGADLLENRITG